ncbi:MAG: TRAP transporter substrate-binding protein, partial [Candidatus Latescibacteria bacterium]|nr:TRAP transporter substrate-binding protein [Candidatus Latescibacterota bacterium]
MNKLKRRDFIKKIPLAGGAFVAGCASPQETNAPAIHTGKTYEWKMVTTWPPHFPILGETADNLAKWIGEMSNGRLKIQVYGGGELIPPLEGFDAVSQGIAEMCHGASYYWAGKAPATQFFAAVPFGMNSQQMNAWITSGGGQALWEELYAPFNLIPMPAGSTGFQMGGWFNREINTIADFQGLKMRMPGLGGKVISKAGGSAVLSAGGEIFTNLERGVIDATEWIGPYHDYLMGFYKAAKYYYYPGWHEPGTIIELIVNKQALESLPKDLQAIVRAAAARASVWALAEFESKNNTYLQKLITEKGVQLKKFPDPVLKTLRQYAQEVVDEVIASDAMSKKIYTSFNDFRKNVS